MDYAVIISQLVLRIFFLSIHLYRAFVSCHFCKKIFFHSFAVKYGNHYCRKHNDPDYNHMLNFDMLKPEKTKPGCQQADGNNHDDIYNDCSHQKYIFSHRKLPRDTLVNRKRQQDIKNDRCNKSYSTALGLSVPSTSESDDSMICIRDKLRSVRIIRVCSNKPYGVDEEKTPIC